MRTVTDAAAQLTVGEVAAWCGVNRDTVRRWLRSGHLHGQAYADRTGYRIDAWEVQRFLVEALATGTYRPVPWLRPLRVSREWTQEQLAQRANVDESTIHRIECGARAKPRTIRALAAALGVPPAALTAPSDILTEIGLGAAAGAYPRRLPVLACVALRRRRSRDQPWRGQR